MAQYCLYGFIQTRGPDKARTNMDIQIAAMKRLSVSRSEGGKVISCNTRPVCPLGERTVSVYQHPLKE